MHLICIVFEFPPPRRLANLHNLAAVSPPFPSISSVFMQAQGDLPPAAPRLPAAISPAAAETPLLNLFCYWCGIKNLYFISASPLEK